MTKKAQPGNRAPSAMVQLRHASAMRRRSVTTSWPGSSSSPALFSKERRCTPKPPKYNSLKNRDPDLFVKEPQIRKIEPADWRRLIEPFRPPECTETDSDGNAFDTRTYPGCCAQLRKAAQDARQAVRQTQLPIFVINRFLKKYEMNPQATGVAGFHGIYINFSRLTSSIYDPDRVLNPRQALYD